MTPIPSRRGARPRPFASAIAAFIAAVVGLGTCSRASSFQLPGASGLHLIVALALGALATGVTYWALMALLTRRAGRDFPADRPAPQDSAAVSSRVVLLTICAFTTTCGSWLSYELSKGQSGGQIKDPVSGAVVGLVVGLVVGAPLALAVQAASRLLNRRKDRRG